MNAVEYMQTISQIRRRIRMLQERIVRDETLAAGVSAIRYDKEKVQTSASDDKMIDIIQRITDATEELKNEIHSLQIKEEEAIGYLVQLKEEHERVLSYHYLDGIEWSEVAKKMKYSPGYIYEVKDNALNELELVMLIELKESE